MTGYAMRYLPMVTLLLVSMTDQAAGQPAVSEKERFTYTIGDRSSVVLIVNKKEKERVASLGDKFNGGVAYCHYINGLSFENKISEKDVIVFSGFWDHGSQGKLLIFNRRSLKIYVINAFTLIQEPVHRCILDSG